MYKQLFAIIREYVEYRRNNRNNSLDIKMLDPVPHEQVSFEHYWLTQFCRSRNIDIPNRSIRLFSVFAFRPLADLICAFGNSNFIFVGENVHSMYEKYQDNFLINKNLDLSIGFDYFDNPRYVRFPYWIHHMLGWGASDDDIVRMIRKMRYPNRNDVSRPLFCSLVASHDTYQTRSQILQQLNHNVGHVCCPGLYNHNDDTLFSLFNNNKLEYLKQFRFNLCPENSNAYGYVTEKIYEAFYSGCIPIYYGSCNRPDPDVINEKAVVFYNPEGDNSDSISLIKELESNEKLYQSYVQQPRLLSGAEDVILSQVHKLESKIREIFE